MSQSAPEDAVEELEEATGMDASDGELADFDDEPTTEHEPEEPQGQPALGPDGFPLHTPVADMAPEHAAAYWRHQARKHEKTAKSNSDAAKRWAEFEESQKSEQQKLLERAEAAELALVEERRGRARLMAAATYNLPADLLDRISGASEDEINDGAHALSQAIEAEIERRLPDLVEARVDAEIERRVAELEEAEQEQDSYPRYPSRPVESLTPGAMPASRGPADNNEWLRRMAGFA